MHRCSNSDHPHCTVWVMPGDECCAHGHPQPAPGAGTQAVPPASAVPVTDRVPESEMPEGRPPQLHVSGFDPRAGGGRQLVKLELRAMPADCAAPLTLLARSRLHLENGACQHVTRGAQGDWLPVFLEFSSRGLEHGQYRIELELHSPAEDGRPARAWVATLPILAPRPDASLQDIHQTYLATRRKLRVHAEDASIARVRGAMAGGARVDIDVHAQNAGIAHLDLDPGDGKIDLGLAAIAWDEDLLEIEPVHAPGHPCAHAPALPGRPAMAGAAHPCPASFGCIAGGPLARHLRLLALDECVLGRLGAGAHADLLLAHHDADGPVMDGLTRRISARHALLRRGPDGYEIEDVSRYGLLVDGDWPGRHGRVPLRVGMRLECTASIPGVVVLEVAALWPQGVLLRRADAGRAGEAFCLLAPEGAPPPEGAGASGLPPLWHRAGGFWMRDAASGAELPLAPGIALPNRAHFSVQAYPELRLTPATLDAAAATAAVAPALAD